MTRFSQGHDDQALTDLDPVAHLVARHIAWQSFAASAHEFHPTGGRGNVLSVHLMSDLDIVGIWVTHVTSRVAAFPDLKQIALQVVLQLAWALLKASCSAFEVDNSPLFSTPSFLKIMSFNWFGPTKGPTNNN